MTDLVIGPWTLKGTDAQNAILKPMAENMHGVLLLPDGTSRVKPCNVMVRKRDEMPWARKPDAAGKGGIRAEGFWTGKNQLLADDLFSKPELTRKTFAHETMHQLDDQWMLNSNRRDIKPLFDPDAAGWPSEPFAVYGSAALFGFTRPPYKRFYPEYTIPRSSWPSVKQIALRDDRPPTVTPPDPCAECEAQLDAANLLIADLKTQVEALEGNKDTLEQRIAGKDASMQEGLAK